MHKILLVEDNKEFGNFLKDSLETKNRTITFLEDPMEALELIATEDFDLLISDLNLPTISGVQLAKTAKNIRPALRIMILTGEPTENSELESIHYNVDLYIEKAKGLTLISEYIDALLNKSVEKEEQSVLYSKSENIILNVAEHSVTKDDTPYDLTPIEFRILTLFLQNKSVVITRQEISEALWGSYDSKSRSVDVHMKNLRSKLGITSLSTIYGLGFKWNEE